MKEKDSILIARVKAGDRLAAERLLRRHEPVIFDFLLKTLRSVHDAEDATQETMVNVLRGLPNYVEKGSFKAWIFQIARREGLRVIRKRKLIRRSEKARDDDWDWESTLMDRERNPAERLEGREILRMLNQLIQRLPGNERRVFLLRAHSGLTFAQIASETGCPQNTALGRMRNALIKLKRWIRTTEI